MLRKDVINLKHNNNNLLHLYSAFLGTQSTLHERGESPQPPPVYSHIEPERPPHTRYRWRGDSDEDKQ